jgi:hypothetical protein
VTGYFRYVHRRRIGSLTLVVNGMGQEIRDRDGNTVGRLAGKYVLPGGAVIRAEVECLVWRTKVQTTAPYIESIKVDGWWVVLPSIVVG